MHDLKGGRSPSRNATFNIDLVAPNRGTEEFHVEANDRHLQPATQLKATNRYPGRLKHVMRRTIDPGNEVRIVGDLRWIAVPKFDLNAMVTSLLWHASSRHSPVRRRIAPGMLERFGADGRY
jgi:hypothetical protein